MSIRPMFISFESTVFFWKLLILGDSLFINSYLFLLVSLPKIAAL